MVHVVMRCIATCHVTWPCDADEVAFNVNLLLHTLLHNMFHATKKKNTMVWGAQTFTIIISAYILPMDILNTSNRLHVFAVKRAKKIGDYVTNSNIHQRCLLVAVLIL
uniref:Uncharacterized protein n=1 Tax=Ixodes ricinus TaxID=34613 RepID=A0A6B0UGY4_IXORI